MTKPAVSAALQIRLDDLRGPEIASLLQTHVDFCRATSPPESTHVLDLGRLRVPEITFWSAWNGPDLIGCGALKEIDPAHGEIKSMHTAEAARGRGVGSAVLRHILAAAAARGLSRVSLETGSWPYFAPARALYARHGFVECEPFGDYRPDPNSVFMTLALPGAGPPGA